MPPLPRLLRRRRRIREGRVFPQHQSDIQGLPRFSAAQALGGGALQADAGHGEREQPERGPSQRSRGRDRFRLPAQLPPYDAGNGEGATVPRRRGDAGLHQGRRQHVSESGAGADRPRSGRAARSLLAEAEQDVRRVPDVVEKVQCGRLPHDIRRGRLQHDHVQLLEAGIPAAADRLLPEAVFHRRRARHRQYPQAQLQSLHRHQEDVRLPAAVYPQSRARVLVRALLRLHLAGEPHPRLLLVSPAGRRLVSRLRRVRVAAGPAESHGADRDERPRDQVGRVPADVSGKNRGPSAVRLRRAAEMVARELSVSLGQSAQERP